MSLARRPPECTLSARLDPIYLREGRILNRENRLIIDGFGEPVRLSRRAPFSEN